MRILLIIDWNRGRGGAEAHALRLRDGLKAAGDEVRLLTSSAGSAGDGSADYVAFGTENPAAQALLQIVNPFAAAAVRRAVSEFRPDVVWINMFAHHLSPAALLAIGDVPKVLLVSDYKVICPIGSKLLPDGTLCRAPAGWVCRQSGCLSLPHWLRDQPRYALIRSAVKRTDRVLACSRWVQKQLAASDVESEVLTLPTAAPNREFVRAPAAQPSLLFCGRLDIEKGVDLLLRALARVRAEFPAARLRIAGQGPERPALERQASSLSIGSSVEFLGWKSPSDLDPLYAEAWACVVPSVWAEPQGLVAIEAMVRRVPVIASFEGGLAEMVEHGVSGLLFPNNDESALVECLRAIASGSAFPEHSLPEKIAHAAADEFSVGNHIASVRRIFAETVAGRVYAAARS